MAITLAEAKVGMADKVDQQVIDTFRRSSLLLDRLVFDNSISPGTNGSTLSYGYVQLKTPATASVRTINSEYTASEAKREKKTTEAVIMGGSFEVDRVIANTSGAVDELAFQAEQKIKATSNYFTNLVINGTSAASGAGYVTGTPAVVADMSAQINAVMVSKGFRRIFGQMMPDGELQRKCMRFSAKIDELNHRVYNP